MLTLLAALTAVATLAAPAPGYEVAPVPDGGAVAGVVRFAGRPPTLPPLVITRDRDACGDRKDTEALVLGSDRGVRGSVTLVQGVSRGKTGTAELVLDTYRCAFVAHVSAVMAGEHARVKNSDAVLHNTHGFMGASTVFNVAVPGREQTIDITRRLVRPGVIRVVCDAHPHMSAWVLVHDSPYYAVTDERGAFRIDGIPPGRYKVVLWHEGFRPRGLDRDGRPSYRGPRMITRTVSIAPAATATLDFELR